MDIDMTALTDEALDEHRVAVALEQERRTNLHTIPTQVADLCKTYRDGGGDPHVLEQAVTGTPGATPDDQESA